ncbi:MAG: toprim domain-containing protein [Patescibacteria group bacterium]|nr:toprim domain-containing protein [Patescibacteria group bacterium]
MRVGGLEARRGGGPAEYFVCCPFCGDTRFRLGVNRVKDIGHCFNCDWRSRTAVADIRAQTGSRDEDGDDDDIEEQAAAPEPATLDYDVEFERFRRRRSKDALEMQALRYLLDRGLTWRQLRRHRIGFAAVGRYGYRVVLPVRVENQTVGLIARDWTGQQKPKYLNSPGLRAAVYGLPEKKKRGRRVALAEGPMDALAMERAIGRQWDCGALLGHALTPEKERILCWYTEVLLWCDLDTVGVNGLMEAGKKLRAQGMQVWVTTAPDGFKDAGEMPERAIRRAAKERQPWSETLWQKLRARVAFR